jgi:hypothetical protein
MKISDLRTAKFQELMVCVQDLQQRLTAIANRAKVQELYGPTVGPLATDIDTVLAKLRILESPAVVSAEVQS